MKGKGDNGWVSASDIGRAEFCPKYLEHRNNGAQVGAHAIAARKIGEMGHDQLNRQVSDSRCYIASHLYGPHDHRTEILRGFRDRRLMSAASGRILVATYYRLSPFVVRLCRRLPVIDRLVKPVVDRVVAIARRESE
ncbi:hypothetical protein DOK_11901 [gamma proteobacterium BDW918]|nr:hypothetical protein DOK_11901 [gamma proteobacterium BDW918]